MNSRSGPLSCATLLAGIIVTVVGGLILAFILGEGPFQGIQLPPRTPVNPTQEFIAELSENAAPTQSSSPSQTPLLTQVVETEEPVQEAPTAIPLPYVANELPWSDDFDSSLSPAWLQVDGVWSTNNGRLGPGDSGGKIVGGNPLWDDYSLSLDVYSRQQGPIGRGHTTRVLVRMLDMRSYASFVIDCEEGTWWEITRMGQTEVVVGTLSSTDLACAEFHLELRVVEDLYEAYVNGELQSSFSDGLFSSGFIGLSTDNKAFLGGVMDFDNLVVREP